MGLKPPVYFIVSYIFLFLLYMISSILAVCTGLAVGSYVIHLAVNILLMANDNHQGLNSGYAIIFLHTSFCCFSGGIL